MNNLHCVSSRSCHEEYLGGGSCIRCDRSRRWTVCVAVSIVQAIFVRTFETSRRLLHQRLPTTASSQRAWIQATYLQWQWPSRTSYHPALCFSSSVIFLLVDACVGLNWLLVSFLSHVNKKKNIIHSFRHDVVRTTLMSLYRLCCAKRL